MIVRCLACGSNIRYDIALGRLYCEACGQSFMPEEFEDEEGTFDAVSYTCQSCGAQLITTDDTEATAFCSFCGSTSILTGKINNIKKPDGILPFKITKEQCQKIYLERARQAFLVPSELTSDECIDSFRAIYMPYWSCKAAAHGSVNYSTYVYSTDGNYTVKTQKFYEAKVEDENIAEYVHDASVNFADDISEVIRYEGTNAHDIVPFHSAYMSGFYADMADETITNHKEKVLASVKAQAESAYKSAVFTGTVEMKEHQLNYVPVWFMSMKYKNKLTYAAINGYTGKIVADFPVSIPKFLLGTGILFATVFALICACFVLRPEPAFWISLILSLVGLILCTVERKRYLQLFDKLGLKGMGYTKSETVFCSLLIALSCILALTRINLVIYGSVALLAAVLLYQCFRTFRVHQIISQRRPPQFNRKGGNDNA